MRLFSHWIFVGLSVLLITGESCATEKQLPSIKVVASEPGSHLLLVPKETSAVQLTDLVTAITCRRRDGKLSEIGIPPTTPKGKKGPYALINLFIFKDPSYATLVNHKKWIGADEGSSFDTQYGQKIEAYYAFSGGQEIGTLGYADAGRPYTRAYKNILPIPDAVCVSTQFVQSGPIEDELKLLLTSNFAKKYGLEQGASWQLRSGGTNIEFESEKIPFVRLSAEKKGNSLQDFSVAFNVRYPLGDPEFEFTKDLLEYVIPKDPTVEVLKFIKSSIQRPIKEKIDPNDPLIVAADSYFTRRFGVNTVRVGKHGDIPKLFIERNV